MRARLSPAVRAGVGCCAAVVLAACNAILGIDDSAVVPPPARPDSGACHTPGGCNQMQHRTDSGTHEPVDASLDGPSTTDSGPEGGQPSACDGDANCDAGRPPLRCSPNAKRCNGNRIERCTSDGAGFALVSACDGGVCNPQTFACGACIGQASSCVDGRTLRSCAASGQDPVDAVCEAPAPFCVAGTCVGCKAASDCTEPDLCHTVRCASGACEYSQKRTGQLCSLDGGYCSAEGRCVSCLDASTCPTTGECFVPVCSSTGACGEQPKRSGDVCDNGAKKCDDIGECVDCLRTADCGSNQVCRSEQCLDAIEDIGLDSPPTGSGSSTVLANWLYFFRLPALKYDATLLSFGIYGDSVSASATVAMALYADSGDLKAPTGTAIAQTTSPIAVATTAKETSATPTGQKLVAGTTYWLAIVSNTATTIPSQSDPNTAITRIPMTYGAAFPSGKAGLAEQALVEWPIYIKVVDSD